MSERDWPDETETETETGERTPTAQGDEPPADEKTPGGVDPLTGEQGRPQSSNADIPAA